MCIAHYCQRCRMVNIKLQKQCSPSRLITYYVKLQKLCSSSASRDSMELLLIRTKFLLMPVISRRNWTTPSQPASTCSSVQELSFRYGFHAFLSVTTKSSQWTVVDSISGGRRIELGSEICYPHISFGFPRRRKLKQTATIERRDGGSDLKVGCP